MNSPAKGSSIRTWLAAALLGSALAFGGYLLGRESVPEAKPPPPSEVTVPAPKRQPTVLPDPLLSRSDIIGLAAAAADQFGGGPAPREAFAGRRFLLRIPFGCGGPAGEDVTTGWRYDEASGTLRIKVAPNDWTEQLRGDGEGEQEIDAVEGFWVPRPWTSNEGCPSAVQAAADRGQSTVGVAQFFGVESNRSGQRRGRPFEFVAKVAPEEVPRAGLQLVIEGRVAQVPGGEASVICDSPVPAARPTCIVAAEFDRVAVRDPASGKELANWDR